MHRFLKTINIFLANSETLRHMFGVSSMSEFDVLVVSILTWNKLLTFARAFATPSL